MLHLTIENIIKKIRLRFGTCLQKQQAYYNNTQLHLNQHKVKENTVCCAVENYLPTVLFSKLLRFFVRNVSLGFEVSFITNKNNHLEKTRLLNQ